MIFDALIERLQQTVKLLQIIITLKKQCKDKSL